jgi:hypothetical protein
MEPLHNSRTLLSSLTVSALLLCSISGSAQTRMFRGGLSSTGAIKKIGVKGGAGMDASLLFMTSKRHHMGVNFDYCWWGRESTYIHIPNNLMDGESITGRMNMYSITMMNYIDLTPESRIKVFAGNRLGYRNASYHADHEGTALLLLPTAESIYKKKSPGLLTEFSLSLYIPFSKSPSSPVGLELKTAVVTGSKITFVDTKLITYNQNTSTWQGIVEKQEVPTFWYNTLAIVWRF